LDNLLTILKSGSVNRKPVVVKNIEDARNLADTLPTDKICPIFTVSSVTGDGIDLLTAFIGLLRPRDSNKSIKSPTDPI